MTNYNPDRLICAEEEKREGGCRGRDGSRSCLDGHHAVVVLGGGGLGGLYPPKR